MNRTLSSSSITLQRTLRSEVCATFRCALTFLAGRNLTVTIEIPYADRCLEPMVIFPVEGTGSNNPGVAVPAPAEQGTPSVFALLVLQVHRSQESHTF